MKTSFLISLFGLLIISCNQSTPSATTTDPIVNNTEDSASSQVYNSDTPDSNDGLEVYDHPDLTAWGGLRLMHLKNELKVIETTQNAELGFIKRIFHIENNNIQSIEYIAHSAEWAKYDENYPSEEFEWNPDKMTYSDTSYVFDANGTLEVKKHTELKEEGMEILEYIFKENLIK